MNYRTERVGRLRSVLREKNIDVFVSAFGPHLRYFTGFTGSNGLMAVTSGGAFFFTDPRYKDQAGIEVTATRRIATRAPLAAAAGKQKELSRCSRIAFDKETSSYLFVSDIKENFPDALVMPETGIASHCMVTKDAGEVDDLRTAASITDRVFTDLLGLIRPGMTEREIAAEITVRHRRYGAEGDAFDVIAASGINTSLPHARPTTRKVAAGDFITLDFGCVVNGYHSDMTRTVAVGEPDRTMKKIYAAVLEAQRAALDAACAGITGKKLDRIARRVIDRHGYGKYFVHGLGHGIGLQIHEEPRVSQKNSNPLPCGSVITIEPGIYLSGKYGVRIEDDVVLRNGGCENITGSPKELIIL